MGLEELRTDCAVKQKKGLHFILASIIIWLLMLIIHVTSLPILTKNLYTFYATAPLMPLAFLISKLIKVDFQNKENPLTNLGILLSVGQIPYLLIAMWVFSAVPEKMLMIMAMIFGAHLLPFSWLYKSKSYMAFAIAIPFLALLVGLYFAPYVLAIAMVGVEIVFSLCLVVENRAAM
ncbi:MAG TPA: hypothetical protein GX014_06930 [Firmicutes bacterium]|jgi:hypothetical protein|nr:hypothetical protein [Bacillota bacterium]HHT43119.1 hypothetical protein [Bacillota bacterium]